MVLLHLFVSTQPLLKTTFAALHMNHHLRGSASDEDQNVVASFCKEHHVPVEIVHFHPSDWESVTGTGVEEKARKLRKQTLAKMCAKNSFDVSVIGHNQDDLCETFLFNFIRGSSPEKLSSILPIWDPKTTIFRPLLLYSRDKIRHYASFYQIPFREDATNQDVQFSRNRIRNNILPEILRLNPRFSSSVLRFQTVLSGENDWIEKAVQDTMATWKISSCSIRVPRSLFSTLHKALQRRSILQIRGMLVGHREDFSFASVETIRNSILSHPQKNAILYSDSKMNVERENEVINFRINEVV